MIDLKNLDKYRENNRIEVKAAQRGLPNSIWETYSAFANTLGGIILLGVIELDDKSLSAVGLADPERLVKEFWDIVNNVQKVNINLLSDKDVTVENANGKEIVVIRVPRAARTEKPIYINGNPLTGSYRRNGEGDYKCSREQVQAMVRDAAVKTQDMIVLDNMGLDVFDYDSVKRYRLRMKNYRPGHVWEELEDVDFLYRLTAVGRAEDGTLHPTTAGLLMFGYEYEIVKEFPMYFLDYQEQMDPNTRWTDRIVSTSGDWSGNVYDFYFRVYNKIAQDIKIPFKLEGGDRIDDTPVHKALREALANCLINADYYGRQGVVIVKKKDIITLSNPGEFRVEVKTAISGGVSDPRNSALIKMFNLIGIGERAGSGIPNIFNVWNKQGWDLPTITENFDPERITLSLVLEKPAIKTGDKKPAIKTGDKNATTKTTSHRKSIVEYLIENGSAKSAEISKLLDLSATRTKEILAKMIEEDIIVAEGSNKNRIYKLKS